MLKARPRFPDKWKKENYKSFVKYRERQVKYVIPHNIFKKMSEPEVHEAFRRIVPGRKIKHYNNRIEKGRVIHESFTKTLPPGKLSDMHGRIRPEVREALLLKPSRTCRLIGTVPFKYGSGVSRVRKQDTRLFKYLSSDPSAKDLLRKWDLVEQERVSVPGVWENQWIDVQECGTENPNENKDYDSIRRAIKSRFSGKLFLPKIKPPKPSDCLTVKTNGRAQTGIISGMCYGRTHKTADKLIRPIAANVFKMTKKRICYDNSIWSLGGRDRRQKLNVDAPLRGRIIMMPDAIPKIVGLTYASRIYDALCELNWANPENECQIGRNDFHGNFSKYNDFFMSPRRGALTTEFDISRHDACTGEVVMVAAFAIIRSMFPPSEDIDRHFLYFMSGTIFKNLVVPGRFIYKLTRSIPSGSPFTSILVTIVNWINCSVLLNEEFGPQRSREFHMNLFGDDTIINMPNWCHKNAIWWVQKFKAINGYDLDPCEIKSFHAQRWTDRPSFLKTLPNGGLPARLTQDLFTSVSFVKRRNRSLSGFITQVTVAAYAAPFNFEGLSFVFSFRSFLYETFLKDDDEYKRYKTTLTRRRIEDNFSYRTLSTNYLYPVIRAYEISKNVDLGNKPKENQLGYNIFNGVPSKELQQILFGTDRLTW